MSNENNPQQSTSAVAQLQNFYNAKAAEKYNKMMVEEMPKVEPDLQLLLQHICTASSSSTDHQTTQGGIIVDVCCGTGDMLLWLANKMKDNNNKNGDFLFRGVDISNDMLNIAREKDANNNILTSLEQGSMESLPESIEKDSCLAILCNFSIHHLLDISTVLSESKRVLRPKTGILYLSFWEGTGEMEAVEGHPVTHYHELATVRNMLCQDLGFILIKERSVCEEIFPGYSMNASYLLVKKP